MSTFGSGFGSYQPYTLSEAQEKSNAQESNWNFRDALRQQNYVNSYAGENAVREFFAGTTFGLSSLISSPFLSEEHKQSLLKYKLQNPMESSLASMGGALFGTLFTGGLGLAKGVGAVGSAARLYEVGQGVRAANTFQNTAKVWGIGGAMMSATDMIDTASLDPGFVQENLGHYAGEILKSGLFGAGLGVGLKGLGRSYSNLVKGEKFFEDAVVPATEAERVGLGNRLSKTYEPIIGQEGKYAEGYISTQQGQDFFKNINFLNQMENEVLQDAKNTSLLKDIFPNQENLYKGHFIAELGQNDKIATLIAQGRLAAEPFYNDWRKMIDIQKETGAFGVTPAVQHEMMREGMINTAKRIGYETIDRNLKAARGVLEESLVTESEKYFSQALNNLENSPNLSKLSNPDGFFASIDTRLGMIKNPERYMDPGKFTSAQIDAAKQMAAVRNAQPQLFNEIEAMYEVLKADLVTVQRAPKSVPNDLIGLNMAKYLDEKGRVIYDKTYKPKAGITPQVAYQKLQAFRQDVNSRIAEIQKAMKEQFMVGNPAVDNLWGGIRGTEDRGIRGEIFKTLDSMFGEFGSTAVAKSKLQETINREERNIYLNLTDGKKARVSNEPRLRRSELDSIWNNVGKVSERGESQWQPANVEGWMDTSRAVIAESFAQLQEKLPNTEMANISNAINAAFLEQMRIADNMRILNDKNLSSFFDTAQKFEQVKGQEGKSIRSNLSFAIQDFAKAPFVPQDMKYGYTQLFNIASKLGERFYKKLFNIRAIQQETAKNILYQTLQNIADVSVQRTRFVNTIKDMSSTILEQNPINKAAIAARNQFLSYSTRLDESRHAEEINRQFDAISKNIERMTADPTQYVQRIQATVGNISSVSPEIAEAGINKVIEQIGLVGQILPKQGDGIYYKASIPLSQKAKFLDSFEALTNPLLMVQKMKYGTITSEQLRITQNSYPDIWEKIVSQVRTDLYNTNPSQEARSRAYSMFGIQDPETLSKAQQNAEEILLAQYQAERPKPKVPQLRQPRVKSLGVQAPALTPQGMPNR